MRPFSSEPEEDGTIRKNLLIAYTATFLSIVGAALDGIYFLLDLRGILGIVYVAVSLSALIGGLYYLVIYIWASLEDWGSPSSTGLRNAMNFGFVLVALGGSYGIIKPIIHRGFGIVPLFEWMFLGLHTIFLLGIVIFGLSSYYAIRYGHVVLRGDPEFGHSPIPRPPRTLWGYIALAGFFTFWSATFFGIFSPVLGLGLISIGGAFVPIGFVLRRRLLRKMAAMSRIKRP